MSRAAWALLLIVVTCVILSVMAGRRSALAHKQKRIEQRAKRLNVDIYRD